jgi:tetratricopeptide (TPR) repeat protein
VIGSRVGRYRVLERLGGGGMGVVYRAEDTRLKRFVALKFLPPELTRDGTAKERFEQEARTASALDHPNVCTIHEIDETPDGQVFICMAYYDGESLKAKLSRGPLSIEETLAIVLQIAEGLAQAHAHGIIHRDVKPANVMLTKEGMPKIVDFGVAMLAGRGRAGSGAEIAGTVSYMSPEQARGATLDQRTDIWSLGVTMYEMLTCRLPFQASGEHLVLEAITRDGYPPVESLRTGVPPQVAAIVDRCLKKRPDERYQRAGDLIAELKSVRRALTSATVSTLPGGAPISTARRRLRPAVTLPLGVAALLAAALAFVPAARHAVLGLVGEPVVPEQLHIAVLPFTNVGNDPANRALCDGLTEILASTLTQFERFRGALWVVPVSDVRADKVMSAAEARRSFGVNLVVTGGVQREGERLRLALNLVDTQNLRQLSSRILEGPRSDLTHLEDQVVDAMSTMLELQLSSTQRREVTAGGTTNPAAYELYVQASGTLERATELGKPEAAAELFQKAIALDPNFALAYAGLARAYLDLYRIKKDPELISEAVASARHAAQLADRVAGVHVTLGEIAIATGRYEDAVREFERALDAEPMSSDAFGGLAKAYEALGKLAEAEATYKKAVALKPAYWRGHNALGTFYMYHGRYDEAEQQYEKVIALAPRNYWGYINLGVLYYSKGEYEKSRAMFEQALSVRPSYAAYSNLGTLAFIRRDWSEAVERFEKALGLDDRDYLLWGNLGIAYHWLGGHRQQSVDALNKAVEMAERRLAVNPRDTGILADLASYHAILGKSDKALACLRLVEGDARGRPDLALQVADVYTDLGEREKAIEWIIAAVKLGSTPEDVKSRPAFDGLIKDPRLAKLLDERRSADTKHGK